MLGCSQQYAVTGTKLPIIIKGFTLHLLHFMFCYLFFDPFFQNPVSSKIIRRRLCCTAMILQILVKEQEKYEQTKENQNKTLLPKTKSQTFIVLRNFSKDFFFHIIHDCKFFLFFFWQTVRHNRTNICRDMLCIYGYLFFLHAKIAQKQFIYDSRYILQCLILFLYYFTSSRKLYFNIQ